jgi:hypothetical protein
VQVDTLGILLGFAAVVFAALEPRKRAVAPIAVGGFVAVVLGLGPARFPEPSSAAFLAAGVASLALARPRWAAAAAACTGAVAGLWAGVLQLQGLGVVPAAFAAAVPPLVSALLAARDGRFAPPRLREEALVLVAVLGLLVALVPDIVAGWHSAAAFGSMPAGDRNGGAAWMLALVLVCSAGGALYAWWRRRWSERR